MRRRLSIGFVVCLTALSGVASGQETNDEARDTGVEAVLESARAAGLPVSYLEGKVREGRAKHIQQAGLVAAITTMRDQLVAARDELRGWGDDAGLTDDSTIVAAAQALRSGVPLKELAGATREAREHGVPAATVLLLATDLKLRGVSDNDSVELARAVAAHGRPEDAQRVLFALDRLQHENGGDLGTAAGALLDATRNQGQAFGQTLDTLGNPPGWGGAPGGKGADPDVGYGASGKDGAPRVPPGQAKNVDKEPKVKDKPETPASSKAGGNKAPKDKSKDKNTPPGKNK